MTIQLQTSRLCLRPVTEADLEAVHALNSLPETDEYNTLGIPKDIDETRGILAAWIAGGKTDPIAAYIFVISHKDIGDLVGMMGLRLGKPAYRLGEVWYKLHVSHWGHGYATEALRAVIVFGFEQLQLHRIEAGCATANAGSVRVLEKAGMKREGMRRLALPLKSGWANNYIYGILERDERL